MKILEDITGDKWLSRPIPGSVPQKVEIPSTFSATFPRIFAAIHIATRNSTTPLISSAICFAILGAEGIAFSSKIA